jgi:hypothetical protein
MPANKMIAFKKGVRPTQMLSFIVVASWFMSTTVQAQHQPYHHDEKGGLSAAWSPLNDASATTHTDMTLRSFIADLFQHRLEEVTGKSTISATTQKAAFHQLLDAVDAIGVVEGHDDDPQVSLQERLAGGTLKGLEGGNYARGLVVTSTPVDACNQSTVLAQQCGPSQPGGPPTYQVYFAKYETDEGQWESPPGSVSVIVIICTLFSTAKARQLTFPISTRAPTTVLTGYFLHPTLCLLCLHTLYSRARLLESMVISTSTLLEHLMMHLKSSR